MHITLESLPAHQVAADALVIPVFEGTSESRFDASDLVKSGEITGKSLELTLLHHPPGVAATRVVLVGGGKDGDFNTAEQRRMTAAAVRLLKGKSIKRVAFALDPSFSTREFAQAAVEGAILGDFDPDNYKTEEKSAIESFAVVGEASLTEAVERGRVIGEAPNFARGLVNEPANRLTPSGIADVARRTAAEFGLECDVLDREQMAGLGMNALLGVAQGSAESPVLVRIEYQPRAPKSAAHLGLVGKGVTFDTGGISIKPAEGMEKMKYDMAGGAAMIAAIRAIAQLKPPVRVTAFA